MGKMTHRGRREGEVQDVRTEENPEDGYHSPSEIRLKPPAMHVHEVQGSYIDLSSPATRSSRLDMFTGHAPSRRRMSVSGILLDCRKPPSTTQLLSLTRVIYMTRRALQAVRPVAGQ